MDNIEEIKRALDNKALSPAYRQLLEQRLRELESKSGQPTETPKPTVPEKRKPYAGVSNMSLDEIIAFFSERGFFRLDAPITGVQALQSIYERMGILGYDREVVSRVAAAIKRLGGEPPPMETIKIDDLLKREE